MLEHSLGILEEVQDAPVRNHLQSCDTCRGDGAELLVISERLREFKAASEAPGRETFADRTRYDVRGAMGETRAQRATASWRVTSGITESQRIRRIAVRRRNTLVRLVGVIFIVIAVPLVALAIAHFTGVIAFAVDRYGAGVEKSLGVNLAALGLRPEYAVVADRARAAEQTKDVSGLDGELARLVRRELSVEGCRAEAVAVLEFASALAKHGDASGAAAIAAAVEHAAAVGASGTPPSSDALSVIRSARALIRSGSSDRARERLDLLVTSGMDLACYYGALAGTGENGGDDGYEAAALALPAVWIEVAWRRAVKGDAGGARTALSRAPGGALRDAVATLTGHSR